MLHTNVTMSLCNNHLTKLFNAIETGDSRTIYQIEHELTPDEECIACTYVWRAHGHAKKELEQYLKNEGFGNFTDTVNLKEKVSFWLTRLGLFLLLFAGFWGVGMVLKTFLFQNQANLSAFGLFGTIILTSASFMLVEFWLWE